MSKKRSIQIFILGFSIIIGLLILQAKTGTALQNLIERNFTRIQIQDTASFNKNALCPGCNVVLIDIDVLRADALPCYGYRRDTTPNICKFAQQSVVFKKNYSQFFWTLPSMFSTATSLYPSVHGIGTVFEDSLSPAIPTLAEIFKGIQYSTFYMGYTGPSTFTQKNGGLRGYEEVNSDNEDMNVANWLDFWKKLRQNNTPLFMHFYNKDAHLPYTVVEFEDEGFSPIENLPVPKNFPRTPREFDVVLGDYLLKHFKEIFTQKEIKKNSWLFDENAGIKKEDLVKFYYSKTIPRFDEENLQELLKVWDPIFNAYMEVFQDLGVAGIEYSRMLYDTKLRQIDEDLADFLNYIKTNEPHTIVIISADHGEEFGEHGKLSHNISLYNEILHTPLILYVPGLKRQVIASPTENIDIFPTILEIIGAKIPEHIQGHSLIPLIQGESPQTEYAVSESNAPQAAIQNERWKLISRDLSNDLNRAELYDLYTDPGERKNVIDQYPAIFRELLSKLRTVVNDSKQRSVELDKRAPKPSPQIKFDEETRKRLMEQGYF